MLSFEKRSIALIKQTFNIRSHYEIRQIRLVKSAVENHNSARKADGELEGFETDFCRRKAKFAFAVSQSVCSTCFVFADIPVFLKLKNGVHH